MHNLCGIRRLGGLQTGDGVLPREPKVSITQKRLEVTSPAIVVLNAFLDSSDLPKEGLSGLLWNFFLA